jgi:hypothetical protein
MPAAPAISKSNSSRGQAPPALPTYERTGFTHLSQQPSPHLTDDRSAAANHPINGGRDETQCSGLVVDLCKGGLARLDALLPKTEEALLPTNLKPRLFAELISVTVSRSVADQSILAVSQEAIRISHQTHLSPCVVTASLMEAAREAQVAMELPSLAELGFSGD